MLENSAKWNEEKSSTWGEEWAYFLITATIIRIIIECWCIAVSKWMQSRSRCQNVASLSMYNLWRGATLTISVDGNNRQHHRHYYHWLVEEIISTFHLVKQNVKVLPKQHPWRGWESKNKEHGTRVRSRVERYLILWWCTNFQLNE